jgi:hypothetical protein
MPGTSAALLQEMMVKLAAASDPALEGPKASAAAVVAGQGAAGGPPGSLLPARTLGSLGALGEFLLGRWQEDVLHEQALMAKGQLV